MDALPSSLDFVSPRNPILHQRSSELTVEQIKSPEIAGLFNEMIVVANHEQKDPNRPVLVGLAAPQVGVPLRIILVALEANGKGKVGSVKIYVNPKIVEKSNTKSTWYEGCFSTGNIAGVVERPDRVVVEALDQEGNLIREEHKGYIARIFQHEIDHLDGVLFVENIHDPNCLHIVEKEEFPQYRNNEGWRTWQRKCPKEYAEDTLGIELHFPT